MPRTDIQINSIGAPLILAGLIAGAIDIAYAIIANGMKGMPAARVLQSVASGLLGKAAFHGGATAMLGLLLHLAMACLIALIFFLAARNFAPIRTHFVVFGLAYGALVYFVMRWIVVPLSRFPGDLRVINPLEILVHMVGVGMVIAIFVRGEFAASGNFDPATAEAA